MSIISDGEIENLSVGQLQQKLSITDEELEKLPIIELRQKWQSKDITKNEKKKIEKIFSVERREIKSRRDARRKREREQQEELTLKTGICTMQRELEELEEQVRLQYGSVEEMKQEIQYYEQQCAILENKYRYK